MTIRGAAAVLSALALAACAAGTATQTGELRRPARSHGAATAGAGSLGWLSGCWAARLGPALFEEQWMAPRAGLVLGMSRTTRGDTVVGYEFLRLEARGDSVIFTAAPSGQAQTIFRGRAGDVELRVENPDHDFPRSISYRAVGSDSMLARLEGPAGGQARRMDFAFARVPCP